MYVACSTSCFAKYPLEQALRVIAELEFGKVDVAIEESSPHLKPSDVVRDVHLAAQEHRILVTSDLRTMPRYFGDFLEAHGYCAGVFLVSQRAPLADVIEALVLVWAASDADEWKNRILEIPLA